MKALSSLKTVVAVVALLCVLTAYARADKLQLQEKLSKEINIQLKDVTIAEALEKIGQKAGVKFVLSDEAVWKLPNGPVTRLSVMLQGPLADSMTEMLNAFFMRYAVGNEDVTIYPRRELEHILGKPTATQLELLRAIYTTPISHYTNSLRYTINQALGRQVAIVPYSEHDEIDSILRQLGASEIQTQGGQPVRDFSLSAPVTVSQLLGEMGVDYTWYLSGIDFPAQVSEIRVVQLDYFQEARLDQIVDISFKDEKLDVVLQRLTHWAGMELVMMRGDFSWLSERISVSMQNTKLKQAILSIVTAAGGGTSVDMKRNQIFVSGPPNDVPRRRRAPTDSTREGQAGYVGKISIPMDGGKYYVEFMLREADLTDELKKLRAEKMKEVLGEVPVPPKKATE